MPFCSSSFRQPATSISLHEDIVDISTARSAPWCCLATASGSASHPVMLRWTHAENAQRERRSTTQAPHIHRKTAPHSTPLRYSPILTRHSPTPSPHPYKLLSQSPRTAKLSVSIEAKYCVSWRSLDVTLSLPRVINVKFPLQPHQKCYVTQYGELGLS